LIYLGLSIGVAGLLALKYSKTDPIVKFSEAQLHEDSEKITVETENDSDKPVYLKSQIRKIVFSTPEEWRDEVTGIEYMAASRNSVVKNYELVGEQEEPVKLNPGEKKRLSYDLDRSRFFDEFDNLRVDCVCGFEKDDMKGTAYETLPVAHVRDTVKESEKKEGARYSFAILLRETTMPVQATCAGCGEYKWLNWVAKDMHVCDDCRKDIEEQHMPGEECCGEEEDDPGLYFVDRQKFQVKLKERQKQILNLLQVEDKLTAKQVSKKLNLCLSTTRGDLKHLYENSLLNRVRIGKTYQYFSLRDQERIILYEGELDEEHAAWT